VEESKGVRLVALALLVALLGTLVAGCAKEEAQAQVAPSDVATLVAGNSAFAFDLFRRWRTKGGICFSRRSASPRRWR
jgi:hypothetical protein